MGRRPAVTVPIEVERELEIVWAENSLK
jgi:hypothetical protein